MQGKDATLLVRRHRHHACDARDKRSSSGVGEQTEGGEALPMIKRMNVEEWAEQRAGLPAAVAAACPWYALHTRSHCEQLVYEQLAAQGFHLFLPKMQMWSQRAGVRHRIAVPMFPGYLFLHSLVDSAIYLEVHKARGLVRILGQGWDRLAAVPEEEILAIRAVLRSKLPIHPHPYLREGQRVRIRRGPLSGVEGILVDGKAHKGRLVLSVELLQQSVAVEVDCTDVEKA
jgi:transcription termination/antitermination protein NusG